MPREDIAPEHSHPPAIDRHGHSGPEATIAPFAGGALIKNADRITPRKSILICGAARGGTSFAASAFHRLGIPFIRSPTDHISRRLEHGGLKRAFRTDDMPALQSIMAGFRRRHPVWAWKLPAIERRFSTIEALTPEVHSVLVFKEPLSVAARVAERKGKDPFLALGDIGRVYQRMSDIVATAKTPLLAISYDRAMGDLPAFLAAAAHFAGVASYDEAAVIAGIKEDAARYFET